MCKCSGTCGCNITSTTKGEKGDASSASTLGYKIYKALLTQTGTSAPVATILENTLGSVPAWSYTNVGIYACTLASAFTLDKTSCEINNTSISINTIQRDSANVVTINTCDIGAAPCSPTNDMLLSNKTTVTILVYP